jgi:hypothetical protein
MGLSLLRCLMVFDASVLMILGLAMIAIPGRMLDIFRFPGLPNDAHYIIAMWGCVLITLGIGYVLAAVDPLKNIIWVQVGIARGALEALVGLAYVATKVVTWSQVGFGIFIGAFVGLSYWALYPPSTQSQAQPQAAPRRAPVGHTRG